MKLGLLPAPSAEASLLDVADWAGSVGFEALEIACWPRSSGSARRYAETCHINVVGISASEAKDIPAALAERNISISALRYYPSPLVPDMAHRAAVIDHLKGVITTAGRMGVGLVNTFCGGDATRNIDDNWVEALRVWPEIIARARDSGVRLAFEN